MPNEPDAGPASPDPAFRLDASIKSRLSVAFDADATEELLSWYQPGSRIEVLQSFLELADQAARGEITITNIDFVADPDAADARSPEIVALTRRIFRSPRDQVIKQDSDPDQP